MSRAVPKKKVGNLGRVVYQKNQAKVGNLGRAANLAKVGSLGSLGRAANLAKVGILMNLKTKRFQRGTRYPKKSMVCGFFFFSTLSN